METVHSALRVKSSQANDKENLYFKNISQNNSHLCGKHTFITAFAEDKVVRCPSTYSFYLQYTFSKWFSDLPLVLGVKTAKSD